MRGAMSKLWQGRSRAARCSGSARTALTIWGMVLALLLAAGMTSRAEEAPKVALPVGSAGLSLVMIEEQGCGFCLRWRNEVGPGYAKSDEGRLAPLMHIDRESKDAERFQRVVYTPTFILMREGAEVGRIIGYAGADIFWWQLTDLIRKHGPSMPARPAG